MTNNQVKLAFANQQAGASANLSTDGHTIKSYHWWEIGKWVNGIPYIRNGQSYSSTTATKHRPGVCGVKTTVETPRDQANMNLDF